MRPDTVEDYLTLTVSRCKELGYFRPDALCSGVIRWTQDGHPVASIGFATDTRGVPVALLHYTHNGADKERRVYLRFKHSNLNPNTGYYYFVCPVTGRMCRKLYLAGGEFVSRAALGVLYGSQLRNRFQRGPVGRLSQMAADLAELENQPRRKTTYRGKPTPYGRRLAELNRRWNDAATALSQTAPTG